MLKRDSSARFWCREEPVLETRELAPGITTTVQTGIKKFWRFRAGGTHTQGELEDGEYLALLEFQEHTPGLVMKSGIGKKRWWMFQDEFYCEDEGYTEEEMKALVLDRLEQKARGKSNGQSIDLRTLYHSKRNFLHFRLYLILFPITLNYLRNKETHVSGNGSR